MAGAKSYWPSRGRTVAETSLSLLDSLRNAPDERAWQRLVSLYTPLVRNWLRRFEAEPQDSDDLVQEVFIVVLRRLGDFERGPRTGAFRRWLLEIVVNCLRNHRRTRKTKALRLGDSEFQQALAQLSDPASALSRQWDADHDQHVTRQLLEVIRPRFEATTWAAFCRTTLDGAPAAEVAKSLGLSINAVFIAKSRVLAQLRAEGRGLLED